MIPEWPGSVVCIGTFDGIHLGHQALITQAVEIGRKRELPSVVLTFDRHPAETLSPDCAPLPLLGLEGNLAEIAKLGVSATVVLPFDKQLARCPAEQFYQTILKNTLRAESVVVGHDFAFGRSRQGTPEWLSGRIETHILPPVEAGGLRVSSSQIRQAVLDGDCRLAGRLLGRPFSVSGVVVAGQKLGRTLGFPTANLARSTRMTSLPHGVYAAMAETPMGRFAAAVGIGVRPTIEEGGVPTIEAYLIDFPGGDLYGNPMRLEFHSRIRNEERFESLNLLKEQMERDVQAIRQVLDTATAKG